MVRSSENLLTTVSAALSPIFEENADGASIDARLPDSIDFGKDNIESLDGVRGGGTAVRSVPSMQSGLFLTRP
jgi:hypothetical protein